MPGYSGYPDYIQVTQVTQVTLTTLRLRRLPSTLPTAPGYAGYSQVTQVTLLQIVTWACRPRLPSGFARLRRLRRLPLCLALLPVGHLGVRHSQSCGSLRFKSKRGHWRYLGRWNGNCQRPRGQSSSATQFIWSPSKTLPTEMSRNVGTVEPCDVVQRCLADLRFSRAVRPDTCVSRHLTVYKKSI